MPDAEYQRLIDRDEESPRRDSWSDLKPHIRPLVASNFISIVCGMNDASIGVIIPLLKPYYNIPNETVSMLFLWNSMGYLVSALANGFLVHKIGQLGALYLGGILVLTAYMLLMNGFPFPIQSAMMLIQGMGVALLDSGMNVYTANVPMATLMLNILHAMYGVGAMISPIVGTMLLAHNVSWRGIYVFLASCAVLNLVFIAVGFRNINVDGDDGQAQSPSGDGGQGSERIESQKTKELLRKALMNRMTLLGAAYILIYVGVEVTLGGWGYTFLTEGRGMNDPRIGLVVAGYWGGLAAGRVVLGYLSERFGEKPTISIFTVLIAILLVVIWTATNVVVDSIAFVAVGFLLGPMFPGTISLASKVLPRELHAAAIGFMAGFGAGGAAFFPFLTGQLSGVFGILSMPIVCLGMTIGMQCIWTFVPSGKRRKDLR